MVRRPAVVLGKSWIASPWRGTRISVASIRSVAVSRSTADQRKRARLADAHPGAEHELDQVRQVETVGLGIDGEPLAASGGLGMTPPPSAAVARSRSRQPPIGHIDMGPRVGI